MVFSPNKQNVFSGIKPTGVPTIGNYLGALKNFPVMSGDYNCLYCIVDMHAITVWQKPDELRKNAYSLLALYIASGLDPDKNIIFVQSRVSAHAELAWVLNCHTYFGEARRMTQFKDKFKKSDENVSVGLLAYPMLMAADILLYQTGLVPVGKDQKQHLEMARDLAERFNAKYSPTFVVPNAYIPKATEKIVSLANPLVKMDKSDENENAYISMLDDDAVILRKFKRAVTDSDTEIKISKDKPGVSNLLAIYAGFNGITPAAAQAQFDGCGYGDLKVRTAESVIEGLRPIKAEYGRLLKDMAYLDKVLKDGAESASALAKKTLAKVYKKIGFIV